MTFSENSYTIGLDCNPHPGGVDGQKRTTVFPGEDTARLGCFSIPAVKAKDPVGFRDRIPALDVGELAPVGLACADIALIEIAPQRFRLFC